MKKLIVPLLIGLASGVLMIGCSDHSQPAPAPAPVPKTPEIKKVTWTSDQPADADSLQGKLQADGKKWVKTTGEIKIGSYVQDTLEGRLNQPEGRGAIGKVLSVRKGDGDKLVAFVDFGRNYRVGIPESELSLVNIE